LGACDGSWGRPAAGKRARLAGFIVCTANEADAGKKKDKAQEGVHKNGFYAFGAVNAIDEIACGQDKPYYAKDGEDNT